jgi:hypothetical protein
MAWVTASGNLYRAASQEWPKERTTDVFLSFTQLLDAHETLTLPAGLKLQDAPEPKKIDETYASFTGEAAQKGRVVTITERSEVRRRQIPPTGYEGFRKAMVASRDWSKQAFRFVKEGK